MRARAVALTVLAFTAASAGNAQADTFTVNTTADTTVAGGCDTNPSCSLRDAVAAANAADGNVVELPAGHFLLNTGDPILGSLRIGQSMTIRGRGARDTIVDGNDRTRVFEATQDNMPGSPRLRSVRVRVGRRLVKRTKKSRFSVRISARRLHAGRHTISIRATATDGRSRLIRRHFSRCLPRAVLVPRFTG